MPSVEFMLFAVIAAALVISVFAVRRARGQDEVTREREHLVPEPATLGHAVDPPSYDHKVTISVAPAAERPKPPAMPVRPPYAPPEGSVMAAQIEVGQTFYVRTASAKYSLTLRDPAQRVYDAVRVGLNSKGKIEKSSFKMLFNGSLVPHQGLVYGWFIPGGRMTFHEFRHGTDAYGGIRTSRDILQVLISVPLRQAS